MMSTGLYVHRIKFKNKDNYVKIRDVLNATAWQEFIKSFFSSFGSDNRDDLHCAGNFQIKNENCIFHIKRADCGDYAHVEKKDRSATFCIAPEDYVARYFLVCFRFDWQEECLYIITESIGNYSIDAKLFKRFKDYFNIKHSYFIIERKSLGITEKILQNYRRDARIQSLRFCKKEKKNISMNDKPLLSNINNTKTITLSEDVPLSDFIDNDFSKEYFLETVKNLGFIDDDDCNSTLKIVCKFNNKNITLDLGALYDRRIDISEELKDKNSRDNDGILCYDVFMKSFDKYLGL